MLIKRKEDLKYAKVQEIMTSFQCCLDVQAYHHLDWTSGDIARISTLISIRIIHIFKLLHVLLLVWDSQSIKTW